MQPICRYSLWKFHPALDGNEVLSGLDGSAQEGRGDQRSAGCVFVLGVCELHELGTEIVHPVLCGFMAKVPWN